MTPLQYRTGLSRVLEIFQLRVRNSTVLKARLLLMMPTEDTADELAFQLHTNHVTVNSALRALRDAGLIRRTRRGGRDGPARHEATPDGESVFALPQKPVSAVLTHGPAQRHPADPAGGLKRESGSGSKPSKSVR